MNLKAYMRGIGAGMIVTALVMGASLGREKEDAINNERLIDTVSVEASVSESVDVNTDDSKENAEVVISESVVSNSSISETGIKTETSVKNETETSNHNTSVTSDADTKSEAGTGANETSDTGSSLETDTEPSNNTEPEVEGDTGNETVISTIDPMPDNDTGFTINEETVEIRIIRGDSSVSVSRRMYEAGLVESAVEFDKFLCQNGYDKYICVGTFNIVPGSDFETMAKTITKRN